MTPQKPRGGTATKKAVASRRTTAGAGASTARTRRSRTAADATKQSRLEATGEKRRNTRSVTLAAVREALTAAAEVLPASDVAKLSSGQPHSATRTWQHAAAGYTRTVPELGAAKMYVGNCLARIRLRVGKRNPDGSVVPAKIGEEEQPDGSVKVEYAEGITDELYRKASECIDTLRSEIGGQSELMRSYGEKMFVAGELYLVPLDTPAGMVFECLSTQELAKDGNQWMRLPGPGQEAEPLPPGVQPIRVWRPDEQFGKLATSSVRACLEVLEELVILTRLVRSSAISRMALAGILVIAEEIDESDSDDDSEEEAEGQYPLVTDMTLSGVTAIDDPASAAAWMPYVLQAPAKYVKDGVNFVQFKSDDSVKIVERREALERLAQGLDLPMEIILGHQQTTYANAAQISQDRFTVHIEPSVQMFCDAVTLGILWPMLARNAGLTPAQVQERGYPPEFLTLAITYDESELVSRPDMTKDILEAFLKDPTQMLVRLSELRGALGLDPDKGPDEEEVAARINAIRLTKVHETLQAGAGEEAQPLPGEQVPPEPGVTASASFAVAAGLAERIAGAAEMTMERCAEKIGHKLRPKLKGAQITVTTGVANAELTRALGPAAVSKLLGDDDPVSAEVGTFARSVARWAHEAGLARPGVFAEAAATCLSASITDRLYSEAGSFTAQDCAALAAASAG